MIVLYLNLAGILVFTIGVAILGIWLRKNPTKSNAETTSRIAHFLFFAVLSIPILVSYIYPGLTHLDELVGLKSLPFKPFFLVAGILIAFPGLYFFAVSNRMLRAIGSGANAFRLTKKIVALDVYQRTRNPMSLGYYLLNLSAGLISGSTLYTIYTLAGLIPAHLFFLKFFEEYELELRFGDSYRQYKQKIPFLIPTISGD